VATPQLGFNYLERFSAAASRNWGVAGEAGVLGGSSDPSMPLAHAIELNAITHDHPDGPQLTANWSWAGALFTELEIRDLAESWFRALSAIVSCASRAEAGGLTPSDLPLVGLRQAEIDLIEGRQGVLEDILPLSPLQQGLLFHALYDEQAKDVYTVQTVFELAGVLDTGALKTAAEALLRRYAHLRAGFLHEDLEEPVQVIPREIGLPWQEIDLTDLDDVEREAELDRFLTEDHGRRFDPAKPPLLRFTLLRLAADRHQLVFTNHHILLDGWSMPILQQELFALYRSGGEDAGLPRATPYREYLAWVHKQDHTAGAAAWQEAMAGLEEATRLAPVQSSASALTRIFPLVLD
jgi:non-ribosomal peptide synthase protein (TIGR01720 family)